MLGLSRSLGLADGRESPVGVSSIYRLCECDGLLLYCVYTVADCGLAERIARRREQDLRPCDGLTSGGLRRPLDTGRS